jgi:hypothetical protein
MRVAEVRPNVRPLIVNLTSTKAERINQAAWVIINVGVNTSPHRKFAVSERLFLMQISA